MSDFPNHSDIFKGINATIKTNVVQDPFDYQRSIVTCQWAGPIDGLVAVSAELMADIKSDAKIGDVLEYGGLSLEIVDFTDLGNFWTVRRANA